MGVMSFRHDLLPAAGLRKPEVMVRFLSWQDFRDHVLQYLIKSYYIRFCEVLISSADFVSELLNRGCVIPDLLCYSSLLSLHPSNSSLVLLLRLR